MEYKIHLSDQSSRQKELTRTNEIALTQSELEMVLHWREKKQRKEEKIDAPIKFCSLFSYIV